jgi:hypothetical protein
MSVEKEKAGILTDGAGQQGIDLQANNSITPDPKVVLAVFEDRFAKDVHHPGGPWSEVVKGITNAPEVPAKKQCPMLKLARFGDKRTEKGSLRHDGNLLEVYGIEADYDAGEVPLEAALEKVAKHDILVAGYEPWSSTPENPRWRLLAPFSRPHPPEERLRYVEALNGMLGGILAPESGVLSQALFRKTGGRTARLHIA